MISCELSRSKALGAVTFFLLSTLGAAPSLATITAGHVDNFNDGTTQHWRIGQPATFPQNVANAGPLGVGDHALFSTNSQQGARPLLIVLNDNTQSEPGPGNWEGSWTAAKIAQISLDVRNPGTALGATALTMRLGIAGPGGVGSSGFGDVYFTDGITVPPDNNWHTITFDVLAADWTAVGEDINAALADVTHFRIFSNQLSEFLGSSAPNEFYLDNIRAIGGPLLAGDYNDNGAVDAADYVVWRKTLNQSVTPGEGADGTGPSGAPDGLVNNLDYDFWRGRFSNTSSGAGSALVASSVPEPATGLLVVGLITAVGCRFRR